jgi:hypothetical protein
MLRDFTASIEQILSDIKSSRYQHRHFSFEESKLQRQCQAHYEENMNNAIEDLDYLLEIYQEDIGETVQWENCVIILRQVKEMME